jgi:hypothetical protein
MEWQKRLPYLHTTRASSGKHHLREILTDR